MKANRVYQTALGHIYAVGDVVGFPSLASTSKEQGRIAVCQAFKAAAHHAPELFPYGIYTIPEISFVGATEESLTEKGIPTKSAKPCIAKCTGHIIGDSSGVLKLLFIATHASCGVHIMATAP